jgi:hypothetical protein
MVDSHKVDSVLQTAIEGGDVFGVVATVADTSGPVYEGAFGRRQANAEDKMSPDTMFRVASMTKVVTPVAAVQLIEAGKLDLDATVGSIVPSWRDLKVQCCCVAANSMALASSNLNLSTGCSRTRSATSTSNLCQKYTLTSPWR